MNTNDLHKVQMHSGFFVARCERCSRERQFRADTLHRGLRAAQQEMWFVALLRTRLAMLCPQCKLGGRRLALVCRYAMNDAGINRRLHEYDRREAAGDPEIVRMRHTGILWPEKWSEDKLDDAFARIDPEVWRKQYEFTPSLEEDGRGKLGPTVRKRRAPVRFRPQDDMPLLK